MTLATALIGLFGVLGGAAIGALGAIYGPSRLHKRQTEQKNAEDAALKSESEIKRIVALRTTGRAWLDALERVAGDVDAGRAIHLDRFDALIDPLRDEATQSAYGMSLNFFWMRSTDPDAGGPRYTGQHGIAEWEANQSGDPTDVAQSGALSSIRKASEALRADVRHSHGLGISPDTRTLLDKARRAREHLNATLLARIEEITGSSARHL